MAVLLIMMVVYRGCNGVNVGVVVCLRLFIFVVVGSLIVAVVFSIDVITFGVMYVV